MSRYAGFIWSVFSCIQTRKNSIFGHFSCSVGTSPLTKKYIKPKNSSVANHLLFSIHSAPRDDFSILIGENRNILLELKENLLIMGDKTIFEQEHCIDLHYCTYLIGPSNKILGSILFAFNSCYVIFTEWTFQSLCHV